MKNIADKINIILKSPKTVLLGERYRRYWEMAAIWAIPLIILLPGFEIFGINLRIENFIALSILPFLIKDGLTKKIKPNLFDVGFLFLLISFLVTILYSYFFRGVPFYPNDFFDCFRVANYYLIYRFASYLFDNKNAQKQFKYIYILSMTLLILVAVAQYYDVLGINNLLHLYTSNFHIRAVLRNGRAVGTFGHSNEFAVFMGIFIIFLTTQLIFNRYQNKKEERQKNIFKISLLFFAFYSLFISMSRSVLVAVFAGLGVMLFFFLVFSHEKERIKRSVRVVLLLIVTAFLSFALIRQQSSTLGRINISDRVEAGFEEVGIGEEGALETISFSKRLQQWVAAIDVISENPFLGFGPSKATKGADARPIIVENEYLGIMMNYGVLGLIAYLYLFFVMIRALLRSIVKKGNGVGLSYSYWVLGMITSVFVYNVFLGVFFRTQSFHIILLIFGLIVAMNKGEFEVTEGQ